MPTTESLRIAESLLSEFETQAPITQKFLQRLPDDKLMWKPHERSMSAGQLAYHLATVPGDVVQAVQNNPANFPGLYFHQPASSTEILKAFDETIATVRRILPQFDDAAMKEIWILQSEGRQIVAQPRGEFLRNIMLSHWYQHRGQFSVYLRILNIPVPATWGPSADEPHSSLQDKKSSEQHRDSRLSVHRGDPIP